jgi:tRNA-2-methylthio-N6-dimethylallyladenosine synthase
MNLSDSERIAGFLESHNLKPTKEINNAGLVVFNTCGVRQMAEDRVYGQIHNIRKQESVNSDQKTRLPARQERKIIILTGCLANRKDVQRRLKDKVDLFCEIKDFQKKITRYINCHPEQSEGSLDSSATLQNDACYLSLSPKYTDKHRAYVPIMTGCNNFCAYCVVPYARGREKSRPVQEIFSEIKQLEKSGCKEIILLGQNVNSYLFKKTTFPKILDSLAQAFPKINFKFLTSHPKDFSEELMKVISKNKNISREIHLPIQAGSDKILRAMNRPYTKKHYLDLIKKAQTLIPNVSFTTDVIVGFPGETEKDFQKTVEVFKRVKFNEVYINKYSPRPGTAAFSLGDPISWEEKKRREKVLRELI